MHMFKAQDANKNELQITEKSLCMVINIKGNNSVSSLRGLW